MELTFFNASSLIIDFMALLILVGMIVYTTLYRRRGKPEDKVFFALILADIVLSTAPAELVWRQRVYRHGTCRICPQYLKEGGYDHT